MKNLNRAVVGLLLTLPCLNRADARDSDPINPAAAKARVMVTAAEGAYMATRVAYEAGTTSLEAVYTWSRRWMESQLKLAVSKEGRNLAYKNHIERMKGLNAQVAQLHRAQAHGGEAEKIRATEFYLAEAELWLEQDGAGTAK